MYLPTDPSLGSGGIAGTKPGGIYRHILENSGSSLDIEVITERQI